MPLATTVKCPRCGKQQPQRGEHAIYRCDGCQAMFDGDPDEGGDFSNFNPAARLERKERIREQRKPR